MNPSLLVAEVTTLPTVPHPLPIKWNLPKLHRRPHKLSSTTYGADNFQYEFVIFIFSRTWICLTRSYLSFCLSIEVIFQLLSKALTHHIISSLSISCNRSFVLWRRKFDFLTETSLFLFLSYYPLKHRINIQWVAIITKRSETLKGANNVDRPKWPNGLNLNGQVINPFGFLPLFNQMIVTVINDYFFSNRWCKVAFGKNEHILPFKKSSLANTSVEGLEQLG